jgi:Rad3-related DNA helicase
MGSEFAAFVALAEQVERLVVEAARSATGRASGALAVAELPLAELAELARQVDAIGLDYALLTADRPRPDDDPWLSLARQVLSLAGALEDRGPEQVEVARRSPGDEGIGLLCLDPSRWLGPRLAALGGFVGLSATLSPPEFHRDLLGLDPDKVDVVVVPSPFPAERRKVLVASRVSTAFKDREQHAAPTAALVSACVAEVPGNVAVYFPSFAMLDDLVGRMRVDGRELLVQRPGMDDALRAAAIEALADGGAPKVLCAVLGGVFAEGIDLPPGALDAVIVVSPALPPVGLERDLLREHYEARFRAGFLYASLVPGTTRVVQAAGRLIRRPEDRGVIVLVDRRFRWREVLSLLPAEWAPELAPEPAHAIRAFFDPS